MSQSNRVSQSEFARRCGVHPSTFAKWIKSGLVDQPRQMGGKKFWLEETVAHVERYGTSQKTA